ncbi:MAG: plasmid replication protein, CyRepA1 family, partial [Waterburya sp.]
PDLYDFAVKIVPDIEIDPITKEVTGTPLYDLLGWPYTRFGHQAKPNLLGAAFYSENGKLFQTKVYGQADTGNKTGKYYAPKGIGDIPYLPPVPALTWLAMCIEHQQPLPERLIQWLKGLVVTNTTLLNSLEGYCLNIGLNKAKDKDTSSSNENAKNIWLQLLNGSTKNTQTTLQNIIQGIEPLADTALSEFLKELRRQNIVINGYWEWFKTTTIPLTITDGVKKTLAGLSIEIPTISLFGCLCGAKTKDSEGNIIPLTLIPELIPLVERRQVNIAFNRDINPKAKQVVVKAIRRLAVAIKKASGRPHIVFWDAKLGKGLDDLIVNQGADYVKNLINNAVSFAQWQNKNLTNISHLLDQRVNQRYLDIKIPEKAQLIGLKSGKKTGKTEFLAQETKKALEQGIPVLVPLHREQLAKEMGRRLGIEYRTELTKQGRKLGYSLCMDSLHANANPPFNPHNWPGALLLLDEADQVIWHALNSPTCQYNRVGILETFKELVQNVIEGGGKIFLSDADLSLLAIEYIEKLIGYPVKRWIVENDYKPNQGKRILYNFESPEILMKQIFEAIKEGQKIIIHTAAQKTSSKWSTINVENLIKTTFKDLNLKIFRLDGESVSDPSHPAYGVMGNLNEILPLYDIVISSPILETGVSIDVKHFDGVYCFAGGVQTVEAVCQTIERVRDDVPRYIYVKKISSTRVGNGSTDHRSLLKSQKKIFKTNMNLLAQTDTLAALGGEHPEHLSTWVKKSCLVNLGYRNYREFILTKLAEDGYKIINCQPDSTNKEKLESEKIKELVKTNKEENYQQEKKSISETENPSDVELQQLKEKRKKTKEERYRLRKGELCRRYCTENISPEMVGKDDDKWFCQLTLHYYLTMGKPFLKKRDNKKLEKLTKNSPGKGFTPDVNRNLLSAQIMTLECINILQFFDPEKVFTDENLREWFKHISQPTIKQQIKEYLNQTINLKDDTPVGFIQRLLKYMFGIKLTCIGQRRVNGKRIREYQMTNLNPDDRMSIFARWFERDNVEVA